MSKIMSAVLDAAGLACLVIAAFAVSSFAGFLVLGVGLVLLGLILDPPAPRAARPGPTAAQPEGR